MAPKRKSETLEQHPPTKVRRTNRLHPSATPSPAAVELETQAQAQNPPLGSTPDIAPAPLTKDNLRLLATMTGSKGPSSRGTESDEPDGDAPSTLSTAKTRESKTLSTTQPGFEDVARRNGIPSRHFTEMSRLPNEDEIEARLNASRASASPTVSFYEAYSKVAQAAGNEATTVNVLNGFVLKDTSKDLDLIKQDYNTQWDKQWTDYPKNVGFNNGLSAPKPDYIEGYSRPAFPPSIDKIGGAATLVKDNSRFIALPHFALEAKAAGKDMHLAEVQAQYDAAAMVYGRNKALSYLQQPDPPQTPAVATVIADGENWHAYMHYEHKDEATNKTTYRSHEIAGGGLVGYLRYKDGYKKIRNLQDMTRENATDLKDRLQKDYEEHGIRGTARTTVASSARSRSAPQSIGSGGSVQSGPARSQATAQLDKSPLSTPGASSPASNSGSRVAQLKAGALPPKPLSNASASSGQARSAPGSVSSSGSKVAQLKAANLPPKPPSNASASSGQPRSAPQSVNSSASVVAQLKAGTRPRQSSSTASGSSGSSGQANIDLGSSNNVRRTDRYRDRDDTPASLQKRRTDSPDRSRPPRNYDQRPRDGARKQTYGDEEGLDRGNRTPIRDARKSINNGSASLTKMAKPPIADEKASPVRNATRHPVSGDARPTKNESGPTRDDKRYERSSISDTSTSSSNRVLKKPSVTQLAKQQTEPGERPEYMKSDEVYVPTDNALYGRRW